MFVTSEDFTEPPYELPGLTSGEGTTFAAFVNKREEKYLREVLGDQLYESFIDGLNDLPDDYNLTVATVINNQYVYGNDVWKALTVTTGVAPNISADWELVEQNNRWLLIKNGSTYQYGGKNYRWAGMVDCLVPLIYSEWVEYGVAKLTKNGFVIPAMENNTSVDPRPYICRAWNDWCDKVGGPCGQRNSLYGYIWNTELSTPGTFDDTFDATFEDFEDYLNYEFGLQVKRNEFDI